MACGLIIYCASAIGMWMARKKFEIALSQTSCVVAEFGLDSHCYHCLYWNMSPLKVQDWFYLLGFTFLVPAHLGSPRQYPEGHKTVVCVC